ncbi:hypothetical protein TRFO_34847 [Tritrichomonas foetus]|uniref:Myb-like DNA-binding domain containing protein n=1 Tax=Tritrichomonas foetus TaxID=1144522 RepID=A0A1J4JMA0_9EUKA|nr:hypothetical protein TRFO_34847 [Tritrichomonas foetus]|eukprot:OHS98691.1 hypothetical protein TRFO_34847 [Tritrichomonas foetus]
MTHIIPFTPRFPEFMNYPNTLISSSNSVGLDGSFDFPSNVHQCNSQHHFARSNEQFTFRSQQSSHYHGNPYHSHNQNISSTPNSISTTHNSNFLPFNMNIQAFNPASFNSSNNLPPLNNAQNFNPLIPNFNILINNINSNLQSSMNSPPSSTQDQLPNIHVESGNSSETESDNDENCSNFTLKNKFSREEDKVLISKVEAQLANGKEADWRTISKFFVNKTARQCRDRWNNYLNPRLTTEEWTVEDDECLLEKYAECGPRWKLFTQVFANRSINNIRNRCMKLLRLQKFSVNSYKHSSGHKLHRKASSEDSDHSNYVISESNSENSCELLKESSENENNEINIKCSNQKQNEIYYSSFSDLNVSSKSGKYNGENIKDHLLSQNPNVKNECISGQKNTDEYHSFEEEEEGEYHDDNFQSKKTKMSTPIFDFGMNDLQQFELFNPFRADNYSIL